MFHLKILFYSFFFNLKVLVLFFNHFERVRGLRSSSLLFTFWALLVLCSSITFRSKILHHIHYVSWRYCYLFWYHCCRKTCKRAQWHYRGAFKYITCPPVSLSTKNISPILILFITHLLHYSRTINPTWPMFIYFMYFTLFV